MSAHAPLVVVGDCLLDIDIEGTATRMCPDEPAPVLEDVHEIARAGGAGLAAVLCAQLQPTILVTALGDGAAGQRVRDLLPDSVTLIDLGGAATVSKTRVRAGGRTLARLDTVHDGVGAARDLHPEVLRGASAILVSDYGLGLTARGSLRALLETRVPVVWDPHPRGAAPVAGVSAVTPNTAEARHFAGEGSAFQMAKRLQRAWASQAVAVTCGAQGAVLAMQDATPLAITAPQVHVADSCGAGDAFAAHLTHALAQGQPIAAATTAAVHGAAEFLRGGGVRPAPTPAVAEPDAGEWVARMRARGAVVVMAGGCFDLLHAGHVAYLQAARRLGDCLIVALNSDDSVRALKGPGRPVVAQQDRARILAALECVDAVVIFDQSSPAQLLDDLRPDIFAKGGDYLRTRVPEADVVEAYGGEVVVLPTLAGRSTTHLVHAARSAHNEEEQCRTQPA